LVSCARETVAYQSDDRLAIQELYQSKKAEEYLEAERILDLAMLEIREEKDIAVAELARLKQELLDMMIIADSSISPMDYMTPKIRASSLLLRPFTKEQAKRVVREFVTAFYRKQREGDEENTLLIENRQGKTVIPFSQIYYLEVREKRVYIRLKDREYSKYDSLENMLRTLPEQFLRCHRSFVFNISYFERVKLSENMIYLENGIIVPLSRSYKGNIKRYLNGLRINRELLSDG
ncbi:MAG: LytTR family transcriptional regulator DNA-binding domain-containing protein, partial [Lachnospiraceae bacterium]|nr:LytTR family transcriptional regulator DNA-binding domain-containing protein [Lachnospiraceae bacterium]